jgi:hypothetical protein
MGFVYQETGWARVSRSADLVAGVRAGRSNVVRALCAPRSSTHWNSNPSAQSLAI